DMLPGITLITSQFEYGRKFLNLAGKLKGKALNFVDDTYKLGKTKIRATYNTVVSKTDDFGRAIRNQIDNIFTGKPQMEFAFTGGFSGYIDDLARSSDDLVEFASHAKNGTDDLARILSSQADEMTEELSEQGLKISDDLKQAGNKLNKKPDIENIDNPWYNDGREVITDGSHFNGKNPKPDIIYTTGEHGYIYKTDDQARIIRGSTDPDGLKLKIHDSRLNYVRKTPDKRVGDHAGHIFGDAFGGSPKLDNLVSQSKALNSDEYWRIEREWEKNLKSIPPKKVTVDIEIIYEGSSKRPDQFIINYTIEGKGYRAILHN
ncbi:MAG: DNA/RNA non-specific endonuclease, partial [Erysipelotrichaceae bacterium]|nr:DNA/RNA non-specific endonuclease [Erysipelotrichaceae bacterium]